MDDATFLRVLDALSVAISGLEQRVKALEAPVPLGVRLCAQPGCGTRLAASAPSNRKYCDRCALERQRHQANRWKGKVRATKVNGAAVVEVVA